MTRQRCLTLVVILSVAFLGRLGFAGLVVGFNTPPKGDEIDYHAIAGNLADGEGFVNATGQHTGRRPPAYPFLLSIFYRIAGPSTALARVIQVLLGTLVVWLTFLTARRFFSESEALVAAALVAVNPFLVFVSGYLLTENLYLILVLLALFLVPKPESVRGSVKIVFAAAVVLGVAALTRPTAVMLGVWMLSVFVLFSGGALRARLTRAVLLAVVFTALILPWCFRNYAVVGGWAGLTTHGGITFLQGNNQRVIDVPHYRGGVAPTAQLPRADELAQLGEYEADKLAWRLGQQFLRENPEQVPRLVAWKLVRLWRLKSDMGMSGIRSGWWFSKDSVLGGLAANFDIGFLYAIVTMPMFLAGLVLTRRRVPELAFLYGIVVAQTAVAVMFFGSLRTRVPAEPVIAVFAAVAVVRLYKWWHDRKLEAASAGR